MATQSQRPHGHHARGATGALKADGRGTLRSATAWRGSHGAPARHGKAGLLGYQHQHSTQTLSEGLEEYYRANMGRVTRPEHLAVESVLLFRSHDICHVIFGLNTTPGDEVLVDARTVFSCDVGFRHYLTYLDDPQAKAIFREFGYWRSVWATVLAIPRLGRALLEAFRMKKRWPWRPPSEYLSRSLSDLRQEFGIRLV